MRLGPDEFAERVFSHFSEYIEHSELWQYVDAVSLEGTYPDAAAVVLFHAPSSKSGMQFGDRTKLFRNEDDVLLWTGPSAPADHLPYNKPELFAWEMWFGLWENISSGSFGYASACDDEVSWLVHSD